MEKLDLINKNSMKVMHSEKYVTQASDLLVDEGLADEENEAAAYENQLADEGMIAAENEADALLDQQGEEGLEAAEREADEGMADEEREADKENIYTIIVINRIINKKEIKKNGNYS